MSRILLSAPNDRPWSYGAHLERALRELGRQVMLFDFRRAGKPSTQVLGIAAEFQPDLHVIWKGERYEPETLRTLARRGAYNVLWHPDADVPSWLPPLAGAADLFCIQSRGMFGALRAAGIAAPEWLMEGVTPSCFGCGPVTAEERAQYACDVATIGTVDRRYRNRLRALARLIREGFHVRWWGRRFSLRRNVLRDWFSPARRAWGGGRVWGPTYAMACRNAKILLTWPLAVDIPGGMSNSAFIATGLGAFYLTRYRAGMEEFFELDREVVAFFDEDEMVAKVRYYLEHEDERRAIAAAGQRRTLENYTNHHAFRRLFQLVAERGGPKV